METPNIAEIMADMPVEKFLIETADHLFKDGEKSRRIKVIYIPKEKPSLMLIINNSLCLWFFKEDGGWKYDGWEMGSYEGAWEDKRL